MRELDIGQQAIGYTWELGKPGRMDTRSREDICVAVRDALRSVSELSDRAMSAPVEQLLRDALGY